MFSNILLVSSNPEITGGEMGEIITVVISYMIISCQHKWGHLILTMLSSPIESAKNSMMSRPVSRSLFDCVASQSPKVRTLPEFMKNTSISWKYNVFILVRQQRDSTACSGWALMPVTGIISERQCGWTSCLSYHHFQRPRKLARCQHSSVFFTFPNECLRRLWSM